MAFELDRFTSYLRSLDRASLTIQAYRRDVEAFLAYYHGTHGNTPQEAAVTPFDVRQYRQYLHLNRRLAPGTVNRRLASLRAYYRWAIDHGRASSSPVNNVRRVKKVKTAPQWLDQHAVARLRRAAEERVDITSLHGPLRTNAREAKRDSAILLTLLSTGLRVAELCALQLDDLSLSDRKGSLTVRQGKGAKQRKLPINRDGRKALHRWLGVRQSDLPWVFIGRRGDPLSPRAVGKILDRIAQRAEIARVTPHRLRHTCAKAMLDTGTPITVVQRILGHASVATTAHYLEPSCRDLRKASEAIAWESEA